jgi:hypothetical protein
MPDAPGKSGAARAPNIYPSPLTLALRNPVGAECTGKSAHSTRDEVRYSVGCMSIDNLDGLPPDHTPLWRYMKFSTLLLLLEGKAYFPAVAKLSATDPLEGQLRINPIQLSSRLSSLAEQANFNHLDNWLFEGAAEWQQRHQKLNESDPLSNTTWFVNRYIEELRRRRAVWCWYNSDIESAAMWSVYGHAGIAVGSTIGALRTSLPGESAFQIARIFYNDPRPSAGNHLNPEKPDHLPYVHRPHLIKGREYEHEHEIRVVTRCYPEEEGRLVRNIAFGTLVKRLIISPILPHQEATAIERFLKSRDWLGPRPEISRSSLLPDDVSDGLVDSLDHAFDAELDATESGLGIPQQLRTL